MASSSQVSRNGSKHSETSALKILGIGASAGGIDALRDFFLHFTGDGLAFVVAMHLDPEQKDMLVEILARSTGLKVVSIEHGAKPEPGFVYVLPPKAQVRLQGGKLLLSPPEESPGLRMPIDSLFSSLADELQERSAGMILSGMGGDGTLGLGAIQERGGKTFVQEPSEAKFAEMPRNAIDAEVAQVVRPVAEMAEQLLHLMADSVACAALDILPPYQAEELQAVIACLLSRTGHDFSFYKKNTFSRRLDRRKEELRIASLADYVRHLESHQEEVERLFQELLIGVTGFFRDPEVWHKLQSTILPELLHSLDEGSALRVWTPGCSTGEEAYSLAMSFQELKELAKSNFPYSLHIFATDLDKSAIEKARKGVFPSTINSEVSAERLKKYFTVEESGFRIADNIRQMITFAPQNLISDPPFTRLDLLLCRNLLIYLEPELQARLIPLFHYSLKPGGVLLLGSSESIGSSEKLFAPIEGKERFFRRVDKDSVTCLADFPSFAVARDQGRPLQASARTGAVPDLRMVTERLHSLQSNSTAVLCDETGAVLYIQGRSGAYLEPSQGKADMNIFTMAKEGLSGSLDLAFAKARRQTEAVSVQGLSAGLKEGKPRVNLIVQAFSKERVEEAFGREFEPPGLKIFPEGLFVLVLFSPGSPSPEDCSDSPSSTVRELSQELENALVELQLQRQEAQASKEELQSGNEELQSLNEELTTSKEEMQSMNEELQTVNQELRIKMEELSQASDDMKNLLNSTDIATLFLDEDLCVRRYTNRTATLISLKSGDAGRPITDLSSVLVYPELTDDGAQVLQSLRPIERQVRAQDGRSFKVSVMPYFTQDNLVDGLVLTFMDMAAAQANPQRQEDPDE